MHSLGVLGYIDAGDSVNPDKVRHSGTWNLQYSDGPIGSLFAVWNSQNRVGSRGSRLVVGLYYALCPQHEQARLYVPAVLAVQPTARSNMPGELAHPTHQR